MINLKKENNMFLIIAIVATIPALVSKYFPAGDSPSHLEIANTLSYLLPNSQEDFFSHYFELNTTLINTNWLFYLLPTLLIKYLPAFIVEKLIVCSYLIIFVLMSQLIGKLNNKVNIAGFLLIPIIYNFALHGGFYSFLFGLELSFFTIAYYLYYQDQLHGKNSIIFFCLFNLIYLLHPFPFAMTIIILFSYSVYLDIIKFFFIEKNIINSIPKNIKIIAKSFSITLYGFPGIICLLLTVLNSESIQSDNKRESLIQLIRILAGFHFLWSYDYLEIVLGRILIITVVSIFIILLLKKIKSFQIRNQDGLIFALLFCLILYFLFPETFGGGGSINIRTSVYIYFLIVLWIGYEINQKRLKNFIKAISIIIFVILVLFNSVKSIQISNLIEEYISVSPYVKENSTIVSFNLIERGLNFEDRVITNRKGIGQVTGYIAVSRNSIHLGNYQATRKNFPIKFRSEIYPRTLLIAKPPKIIEYNQTKGRIDYVLLWGASYTNNKELLKSIKEQLNNNYHLVHTSVKRGLAELYEINSSL